MARAPERTSERVPLGFSFYEQTSEAIKIFVAEIDSHFKFLEDVLQEAKVRFGRRESTDLLPKTPYVKKRGRTARVNITQQDENTDPSSTEEVNEQECRNTEIDEPVCPLPLQAIFENKVLDASSAVDETGKETRLKAGKKRTRSHTSQQQQQPKRSTRSSKKQTLEEKGACTEGGGSQRITRSKGKALSKAATEVTNSDADRQTLICKSTDEPQMRTTRSSRKAVLVEANVALQNTCTAEASQPKRVTRSKQKKNLSNVPKSPAVTTVTEELVSSETKHIMPKEQTDTTEVVSDAGTTDEPEFQDTSLEVQESSKKHKTSAKRKRKSTERNVSVPETPEVLSQSVPSSKKACRPSLTIELEPVTPNQAYQTSQKSLICISIDKNKSKEQITTEVISDSGNLEVQESSKKCSPDGMKMNNNEGLNFVPETPEVSRQSVPPSKKACRPSAVMSNQADQTGTVCGEDVKVTSSTEPIKESELTPQKNEGDIIERSEIAVSSTKDAKKRKKQVDDESDLNVSSTEKLERVSKTMPVEEMNEYVSSTTEELACPKEVKQGNVEDDTEDSKFDTDKTTVPLTVQLTKEPQPESNKHNTRSTRSSKIPSKSVKKTHSLVKSSVTLTLTRSPLLPPASKRHASEKHSSSSPEESSDSDQAPAWSEVKQNLFSALQDGSDGEEKSRAGNSNPKLGLPVSHFSFADEQRPVTGSGSDSDAKDSDDIDGQGYAASQEGDNNEDEDIFHVAEEELGEAVESKGVGAHVSPGLERKMSSSGSEPNSAEEVESDKAKEFNMPENQIAASGLESDEAKEFNLPENQTAATGPNKEDKPNNLATIHSFIRRDTPKKVNPEEEKEKRAMALKKKQEKEKERKEQLDMQKQKEAEEKKRKREEREKRVADLRAEKAKLEEERKRKMQEKFQQKKCADEKAKKRREKEEEAKKKLRQQKKAELDARRKQEEENRKQRLLEQEEEARRQRELVQMKLDFEEQERQRKITEAKRQQELREKELDRERELEKLRKLKEIEEKEKKVREKEEREREEKAKKYAEEKEKRAREREEREREEKMERKAKEAEEKLKKERARITKLIQEKEEQQRLEKERQENEKRLKEAREAERKRQEEIKRQEIAEKQRKAAEESRKAVAMVESYEMTPPPPPKVRKAASKENYDITDLCSDDSTDDEDAPRKAIPAWAQKNALWASLLNQQISSADVDAIFGSISPPNLEDIFKHRRKRFYQRTSSACWDSPPMKHKVHATGPGFSKHD